MIVAGLFCIIMTHACALDLSTDVASFNVTSNSMSPAFEAGDTVVAEMHVNPNRLKRGDIILMASLKKDGKLWPKRIIAVTGDRIGFHHGRIVLNGEYLDEPYVAQENNLETALKFDVTDERTVPKDHFCVLGDNRDHSYDCKDFGMIHRSHIRGKIVSVQNRRMLSQKN